MQVSENNNVCSFTLNWALSRSIFVPFWNDPGIVLNYYTFTSLGNEIPRVKTGSKVIVLKRGDETTISCNITDMGIQGANTLRRISWYKDGKLLKSVRRPDPAESDGILQPVIVKDAGVKDGGRYTCLLEVLLRNVKGYNVSDATLVNSK